MKNQTSYNSFFLQLKKAKYNIDFVFLILVLMCMAIPVNSYISQPILWVGFVVLWGLFSSFKINLYLDKITFLLGCTALYLGFSFFFNAPDSSFNNYRFLELIGYVLLFLLFKNVMVASIKKERIHLILNTIIAIGFLECALVCLQILGLLDVKNLFFKALGTFTSPNYLGVFVSISLLVTLYKLLHSKKRKTEYYMLILHVILSLIVLVLSTSRTAMLILLIGGFILCFNTIKQWYFVRLTNRNTKAAIILITPLVLTILFYFIYLLKKDSADGRFLISKITLKLFKEAPFWGHGLFSFAKDYNTAKTAYFLNENRAWSEVKLGNYVYNAFNDYLYFLHEIGVVGLLLVISLFVTVILGLRKNNDSLVTISSALVICLFVGGCFMSLSIQFFVIAIGLLFLAVLSNKNPNGYKISGGLLKITRGAVFLTSIVLLCFTVYYNNADTSIKQYKMLSKLEKSKIDDLSLEKIYKSAFDYGYSHFFLGSELVERGGVEKGIREMELGLSLNVAPKLVKSLAYTHINYGNYKRAEELLQFNIGNEPFRFEPRMNLFQFYKNINAHNKAKQIANQIIDLKAKIPSKEVDNLKQVANYYLDQSFDQNTDIKGTLSQWYTIYSNHLKRGCNYKMYLPNVNKITSKLPVIYITDGQHYSKSKFLLKKIDDLIERREIKPIALIFIDPRKIGNAETNYRQEYFLCNPSYVDFIVKELLPEVELYAPISNKRADRTILGHSFGGLFSAYLGFRASDNFMNIGMQSPAFNPCPDIYNFYKNSLKLDLKLYMSYGTGNDTEQQDLPMIQILQNKGYPLKVNRVEGGNHDWKLWMDQMEDIVLYFYKN